MSAMGGMYTFLTVIQVITMTAQPILYIVAIIALIFAMRALLVYTKNNKKPKITESNPMNQLQGSVFGSQPEEAKEATLVKEESKEGASEVEKTEPNESANEKTE